MKINFKKNSPKNDVIDEILFKIAKKDCEQIPENIHSNILKTISKLKDINKYALVPKKKKHFNFSFNFKEKLITSLAQPIKAFTISCLSVMLVTTSAVGARNISEKFLNKDTVRLDSIGIANEFIFSDEMEDALIQNVPLNLIQLNDDYYINVHSVLLDEINFFTVFELHCKNGVTDDLRFSINDLEISDENGNVLYNAEQEGIITITEGWKSIYNTPNSIKELFFMFGNDNSKIETLTFSFSDIHIYRHNTQLMQNSNFKDININFEKNDITIPITKDNYNTIQEYVWEKENIENHCNIDKILLTKTGLYITVKNPNSEFDPLIKINNKFYNMLYNLPLKRLSLSDYLILLVYDIKDIPNFIQFYNTIDKNIYNLIPKK